MTEIKRYTDGLNGSAFMGMYEAPNGECVMYEDAQRLENESIRLTTENAVLQAEIDRLRLLGADYIGRECQLRERLEKAEANEKWNMRV